ncbi:pancreatic triacylglycerol lipase-like isoform X2 [Apostichopus japonicus]|uniref:pancreatic triacylglycerol lipase-like isoform X2 n=1 Tax=Stichopus japonicus TaxID=307972 RepID=UPI003AB4A52F
MRVPGLTVFVMITMNISIGWCNEVCFDGVGCFTDDLECHKNFFPPMGPEEIVTSFTLFTRKSKDPVNGEPLETSNRSLLHRSTFRANKKTVFIIHGWGEHGNKAWIQNLRKAILQREKSNVIIVDWYEGADELNYWKSVQNIRVVGSQLAHFLIFLKDQTGVSESSVHLVGHSLGAHLAGYTGQYLPGIGRITALDAAGPSFEKTGKGCRLDKSDALFVDAIHTDSVNGAGISQPIGHRDFYPNGGHSQPGCEWWQFVCDHARANEYFIESVLNRNCGFRGVSCESEEAFANGTCGPTDGGDITCPRMGYYSNTRQESLGKFILYTESTFPFCAKRRRYDRLYRKWRGDPDDENIYRLADDTSRR